MTDAQLTELYARIKGIEEKIDAVNDKLAELPEQIEEFVIRIEDAARDSVGGDY